MKLPRKLGPLFLTAVILALAASWLLFSVTSPLNRSSTIRTTLEWARLAPFPVPTSELHVETSGSPFTRQFRVSFTGDPQKIQAWLEASPGTHGLVPAKDANGWLVFSIDPNRAQIAEVHLSPDKKHVKVIAVWS